MRRGVPGAGRRTLGDVRGGAGTGERSAGRSEGRACRAVQTNGCSTAPGAFPAAVRVHPVCSPSQSWHWLLEISLLFCVVTLHRVNLEPPEYSPAGILLLVPCRAAALLSSHGGGPSPPPVEFSSLAGAALSPTSLPVEQMRESEGIWENILPNSLQKHKQGTVLGAVSLSHIGNWLSR